MCRLFRKLKCILAGGDWVPVWADIGEWNVTYYHTRTGIVLLEGEDRCGFEIQYSPRRNRYRLKTSGEDPLTHHKYKEAVEKFNEFIHQQKHFKSDPKR